MMTTLENTISVIKALPEADLTEVQNFAQKLLQLRNAGCPFSLKTRDDIYKDLEISRQQIVSGEYQDAKSFITEVREEYGI